MAVDETIVVLDGGTGPDTIDALAKLP